MDADQKSSREQFQEHLDAEGVDIIEYAHEEKRRREKHPGETEIYEKSRAFEDQVIETVKAHEKSGEDALTGAKNLRFFDQAVERLQKEAQVKSGGDHRRKMDVDFINPFGLIVFDIDHFKKINDTYGHPAGDQVLKEIVWRVTGCIRKNDILARCGGEEFRIIALAVNGAAKKLAETVRILIADTPFTVRDNQGKQHDIEVTISVGVAPYDRDTANMEQWADSAMYQAKEGGRNRVQVWKTEPSEGRAAA